MQHLSEIVEEARKKGKKRLAVAYGQDAHTLAAVYAAYKEGLVEPILFGDPKIIEQVCKEENIDCNIFKIIPESNDVKCVNLAVNAVVTGEADVLMKGLVSTDKYMRGILNKDAGLFPPKGTLSHVAVVEMPNYPKLLVISDVAVIPQPDFKQKTILIGYLTRIANLIGIKTPKIACIAPSEQLLPSVLSSTEAALLAKMGDRGQLGNVVIDGPLSLDVALYKEAAEIKKVKGSSVAGDADCLLFPNIESGNVFFKASTHIESCRLVQGSQCFVRKIIPEQPAQRVQNPCKQRRLQPLPCRALLEARERVCTARQREWYRRELDVTRSLSLERSRGQGLFLFQKLSLREWIRSGTGIGATPCS